MAKGSDDTGWYWKPRRVEETRLDGMRQKMVNLQNRIWNERLTGSEMKSNNIPYQLESYRTEQQQHFPSNIQLNYKEHSSLTTSLTQSSRERDLRGGAREQQTPSQPMTAELWSCVFTWKPLAVTSKWVIDVVSMPFAPTHWEFLTLRFVYATAALVHLHMLCSLQIFSGGWCWSSIQQYFFFCCLLGSSTSWSNVEMHSRVQCLKIVEEFSNK